MNAGPDHPLTDWDARAQSFQTDLRGVLFKSFPPTLNRYLHDWHLAEVRRTLAGLTRNNSLHVLDVGCGYGRLSTVVRQDVPQAFLTGIDRSATFARLYRRHTRGESVVSDLAELPVRSGRFDLVFLVTTLMYFSPPQQRKLLAECVDALKPDGRLLLIENSRHGRRLYSGFGLLPLLGRIAGLTERSVDTGGFLFTYPEIERLIEASGGRLIRRSGVVRFTALLPLLLLVSKGGGDRFVRRILEACRPTEGTRKYSLHICYEVARRSCPESSLAQPGQGARNEP